MQYVEGEEGCGGAAAFAWLVSLGAVSIRLMCEWDEKYTMRDTRSLLAEVADWSGISDLAVIGAMAEWRDRKTVFPAVLELGVTVREFARVHAGVERPTQIGMGSLLMAGSHVGHDAIIGDECEIAPNAVIGGCCILGNRVKIGMGAMIRPWIEIGDGARIGAGAVVTKNVPAGEVWAGNPARRLER